MKILYVPYSVEDALDDLELKARKWQKNYDSRGKEAVVAYHGSINTMLKDKVQHALKEGNCQVYVLSHGVNTPELIVANQTLHDDNYREMNIDEVARHFERDLLSSEFKSNNSIKLYFCDEYAQADKSRKMAERFRSQLGEPYHNIEVKYYTDVSVGIPGFGLEGLMGTKGAIRSLNIASDLFNVNLSCIVGNPKSFRHGLDEPIKTSADPHFFKSATKVKYPDFSHPIIKQFADGLVKIVQSDKIFSKNQDAIIKELLRNLPTDIDSYLVESLTIDSKQLRLELKINKVRLESYLQNMGIIPATKTNGASPLRESHTTKVWVDEDDYLKVVNTSFKELGAGYFLTWPKQDEELDNDAQEESKMSI